MNFTGERVILGQGDQDLINEHLARYYFAQRFSSGKIVLDAACGSGYGSAMLAENAKAVVGVDISQEAVDYSRAHYTAPNLRFSTADCMVLPFPGAHFDLVVAFEIIEHLHDPTAFLKELERVLNPSGLLIISTPNRLYYTEERGEINPFHEREFTYSEFDEILARFSHWCILCEDHVPGLLIAPPGERPVFSSASDVVAGRPEIRESGIGIQQSQFSDFRTPISDSRSREEAQRGAYFFVAVCSHEPLDAVAPLLYLPSTGNVLREREKHIRDLTKLLAEADAEAERARTEAQLAMAAEQRVRAEAQQKLDAKEAEVAELRPRYEAQVAERTEWARSLDAELKQKSEYLAQLQADYDSKVQWAVSVNKDLEQARAALQALRAEFEERTAWALQLDSEVKKLRTELGLLVDSRWYRLGKSLRVSPVPPSDQR
ncbi:MAG: methyltransferase domain-containing protein [Acidobacteria bacterium]|nr:methyltransferase domain-containing protein [Acidobacteriota bacterium]